MKYTDKQRLQKIYDNAIKLHQYIIDKQIKKEDLLNDYALQWLVTTPLYNIGENAYCLTDTFKEEHREIEWDMMAGLRHRLVHDYEGTNWNIIVEVVFDELPVLIQQIEKLIILK